MLSAVVAIIRPVVECDGMQIDCGRTFLREIVFGDAEEPQHRNALTLSIRTEVALANIMCGSRVEPGSG